MVILAIGAHPDDIEFGCYGTLSLLSNNQKVIFLILTNGEIGGNGEVRKTEAEKSAKIMGAEIKFLDFPDGKLEQNGDSVRAVKDIIERNNIDTVFTHYFHDTHQDHVKSSLITLSASSGNQNIKDIYLYEAPSTKTFSPSVFYNISSVYEKKLQALSYFESQKDKAYFDKAQILDHLYAYSWKLKRVRNPYEAFVLYASVR